MRSRLLQHKHTATDYILLLRVLPKVLYRYSPHSGWDTLSYRNIEEMMKERGIPVDHATINRWVIKYAALLEKEFRNRHKRPTGKSWRMDETYVKNKGKWGFLYRAVDKEGDTVDFMFSAKRDCKAALRFFKKAIGSNDLPHTVTIDKSGANNAALEQLNMLFLESNLCFMFITIRQIKYLNNS